MRFLVCAVAALSVSLSPVAAGAAVSTVAGTGVGGFSGDGGLAVSAAIDGPRGVAWMPDGGFVFTDFRNERVRRVAPGGQITTLAGTGATCGSPASACGDGGPATLAQFNFVHGVAVLGDGSVVIADMLDHRIRRVDAQTGVITTVAGTGAQGFSGDGGRATAAAINSPRGVATRGDDIFIPDSSNGRVRKVSGSTGVISTVAGGGAQAPPVAGGASVSATGADLGLPFSVAPTSDGGLLIADQLTNEVDRVGPGGNITRVAGQGVRGDFASGGDGGPASAAIVSRPHSVVEVPPGGPLAAGGFLIAEMPPNLNPAAFPDNRVRYVGPDGTISTVVNSSGIADSTGDGGPAITARINGPRGLAIRPDGTFLIAEFGPPDFAQTGGDRVRSVTLDFDTTAPGVPSGVVAVAGAGSVGVDWADGPEADLAGYDVYRGSVAGGPYVKVNASRLTVSAFTDSGVSAGQSYFYVVRAVDVAGNQSANSVEVSAMVSAGGAYRQAVLGTAGLVSYWRLGERSGSVAVDAKGANDGAYAGGVSLGQAGLVGDSDTAAGFDGADDVVRAADFAAPASVSLEAWIRPADVAAGQTRVIMGKGNSEYNLRVEDDGSLLFRSGSPVQDAVDSSLNFASAAAANRAYHVVVVFDSVADTVRFYRDGALTKTVTNFTAAITDTPYGFWIGRHSQYDFGTFNGRIDDVAVYTTALSAATIQQHYQAAGPAG